MTTATDDTRLLVEYVSTRSTQSLGRLIERHIDFVYAAARRQVRDATLADDVTQAVFIILAKKAASIRPSSLSGWLFNTTRHCAANARRAEMRRHRYERLAAKTEVTMPAHFTAIDNSSDGLHGILDDGIARLSTGEREVVLLRYLQGHDFSEVSAAMGITEQAARKRLTRAVARLRKYFADNGVAVAPAVMIGVLETAQQQAPSHLLHTTTIAAAGHFTAGATSAHIAAKTMRLMGWIKLKIAAAIVLGTIAGGAATATVVHHVLAQSPVPADPPAQQTQLDLAQPTTNPSSFATQFSDGIKVELIGLSENPSTGKPWWKPDGSPLAKPPYDKSTGTATGPGMNSYEMAIRIINAPKDLSFEFRGGGAYGQTRDSVGGAKSIMISRAFATLPGSPTTVRMQLATLPIQTRAIAKIESLRTESFADNGVIFDTPTDSPDGLTLAITDQYTSEDCSILAVDLNNKTHYATNTSTDGGILTQKTTAKFRGLKLARTKEFRFLSRPYDRWVEFRNVSLHPEDYTDVQIQTSESTPPK